jgi:hypothetical protein
MKVGTIPATFLDVPAQLYKQFLCTTAHELDMADTPLFICEFPSHPVFRLFLDFDFIGIRALSLQELQYVARVLQDCIREHRPDVATRVIITGHRATSKEQQAAEEVRTGCHLRAPNTHVTMEGAQTLRDMLVQRMQEQSTAEAVMLKNAIAFRTGDDMMHAKLCECALITCPPHSVSAGAFAIVGANHRRARVRERW